MAWSVVPSPNPGTSYNHLSGVSCASASSCVAVGSDFDGTAFQTLIESWDGTVWSVEPSPNVGTSDNALSGVSCVSAISCTAIGFYGGGRVYQTLIEVSA